jgi:hypothetical protein
MPVSQDRPSALPRRGNPRDIEPDRRPAAVGARRAGTRVPTAAIRVAAAVGAAAITGIALATVATPTVARADLESWTWVETRTPIARAEDGRAWLQWRTFADARLALRTDGVDNLFLRVGPLVDVAPWLFVAAHVTALADQVGARGFETELRAELEPNLRFRAGDFAVNDRNRVEYRDRTLAAGGVRRSVRYRNQLRIAYAPEGQWWQPFLWDEVLVDSIAGLHQNRLTVGCGFVIAPKTRLDVGYMLRSRDEPDGWAHDHILLLYLFLDVPERAGAPVTRAAPAAPAAVPGSAPPAGAGDAGGGAGAPGGG